MVVRSAFVGVPGLRTFSLTASGFTPKEPLLFHFGETANPHGICVPMGLGDGGRFAERDLFAFRHLQFPS